ncbi:MAG: hypothetical protein ACKV2T_05555 [Kofleriaceae bacterium]
MGGRMAEALATVERVTTDGAARRFFVDTTGTRDAQLASVMRSDEDSEDPKRPKPVKHRKKSSNRYELLEADDRTALRADDLDRHRHVS